MQKTLPAVFKVKVTVRVYKGLWSEYDCFYCIFSTSCSLVIQLSLMVDVMSQGVLWKEWIFVVKVTLKVED